MLSATMEGIAYATKNCEISQGLKMKNPSMWQKESAVLPTFYIIFCSPKITNLRKHQALKAATSAVMRVIYKSDNEEKHSWKNKTDECCRNERPIKGDGHRKPFSKD